MFLWIFFQAVRSSNKVCIGIFSLHFVHMFASISRNPRTKNLINCLFERVKGYPILLGEISALSTWDLACEVWGLPNVATRLFKRYPGGRNFPHKRNQEDQRFFKGWRKQCNLSRTIWFWWLVPSVLARLEGVAFFLWLHVKHKIDPALKRTGPPRVSST